MRRRQCVTYVFGLTSTARIMSFARRKKTHALGRMPLLDAMTGRVYLTARDYATDQTDLLDVQ